MEFFKCSIGGETWRRYKNSVIIVSYIFLVKDATRSEFIKDNKNSMINGYLLSGNRNNRIWNNITRNSNNPNIRHQNSSLRNNSLRNNSFLQKYGTTGVGAVGWTWVGSLMAVGVAVTLVVVVTREVFLDEDIFFFFIYVGVFY